MTTYAVTMKSVRTGEEIETEGLTKGRAINMLKFRLDCFGSVYECNGKTDRVIAYRPEHLAR